jgi:hypothetical protein
MSQPSQKVLSNADHTSDKKIDDNKLYQASRDAGSEKGSIHGSVAKLS